MTPLFKTKTTYDLAQFDKFSRYIRRKVNHLDLLNVMLIILFVLLAIARKNPYQVLGAPIAILAVFIFMKWDVRRSYKANPRVQDLVCSYDFYPHQVVQHNKNGDYKLKFADVTRIYETATHFYIMMNKQSGFVIVKKNCTDELQDFLRKKKDEVAARSKKAMGKK